MLQVFKLMPPETRRLPVVSVITPAHNAGPFIESAVRSVLGQSTPRFEIIVVDDASTDDTAERVVAFADHRVRLLRLDRNVGVSAARNEGIRVAQAHLLAFLDADDQCESERLSRQLAFLALNSDVDVLGSAISVMDDHGRRLGYRAYPLTHEEIRRHMEFASPFALSAVVARKAAVLAAGGFNPTWRLAEDYDLWSRMALAGCRFANLPEPLTRYRVHSGASKAVALKAQIRATRTVKKRYWRPTMRPAARARLAAEGLLLLAPSGMVLRAFVATAYKRELG
jgi:glycosyltransferase involved in cell wall biosynthesis